MTTTNIFLHQAVVFLHITGATMIVGIWFANMKNQRIMKGQGHAAILMLITGVTLIFMNSTGFGTDHHINHMKVGIKFLITLVITALIYLGMNKDDEDGTQKNWANAVGILGIINIAIAVFW